MAEPGSGESDIQAVDLNAIERGEAANGEYLAMNGGIIEATRHGGMVVRHGDNVQVRGTAPNGTVINISGFVIRLWHHKARGDKIYGDILPRLSTDDNPNRNPQLFLGFEEIVHNSTEQARLASRFGGDNILTDELKKRYSVEAPPSNPPVRPATQTAV